MAVEYVPRNRLVVPESLAAYLKAASGEYQSLEHATERLADDFASVAEAREVDVRLVSDLPGFRTEAEARRP